MHRTLIDPSCPAGKKARDESSGIREWGNGKSERGGRRAATAAGPAPAFLLKGEMEGGRRRSPPGKRKMRRARSYSAGITERPQSAINGITPRAPAVRDKSGARVTGLQPCPSYYCRNTIAASSRRAAQERTSFPRITGFGFCAAPYTERTPCAACLRSFFRLRLPSFWQTYRTDLSSVGRVLAIGKRRKLSAMNQAPLPLLNDLMIAP